MFKEKSEFKNCFDAHLHIIDPRFPLVSNKGYLPDPFTVEDYLDRMKAYHLLGGAVVSGSFQTFDQTYLIDALGKLGDSFVGVTQLPHSVSDEEILRLNALGVKAIRFNLFRGGSESIAHLEAMAARAYELAKWHVELYLDSKCLPELSPLILGLPKVSIDHLGLNQVGFPQLLELVGAGVHVKATGFSRGDLNVKSAMREIYNTNPNALIFGTDLPSTRAPMPYQHADYQGLYKIFDEKEIKRVTLENAKVFYQLNSKGAH